VVVGAEISGRELSRVSEGWSAGRSVREQQQLSPLTFFLKVSSREGSGMYFR
jgi:hypothetical protein